MFFEFLLESSDASRSMMKWHFEIFSRYLLLQFFMEKTQTSILSFWTGFSLPNHPLSCFNSDAMKSFVNLWMWMKMYLFYTENIAIGKIWLKFCPNRRWWIALVDRFFRKSFSLRIYDLCVWQNLMIFHCHSEIYTKYSLSEVLSFFR